MRRCCEIGKMSAAFLKQLSQVEINFLNGFSLRGLGYKSLLSQIDHPLVPKTLPFDATMKALALSQKDKRILKPINLFEGKKVFLGVDHSIQQREKIVEECINQQFVLQEFIASPQISQIFYQDGDLVEKKVYFDICPHLFIKEGEVIGI